MQVTFKSVESIPFCAGARTHGSVIPWQHINLLGEYDFSDEKLRDSVGIRSSKLTP
jgi:hypothetical protein